MRCADAYLLVMCAAVAIPSSANLASGAAADDAPQAAGARISPVPFTEVHFEDDFWAPRINVAIRKSIPHCLRMCEETHRIRNWEYAARGDGEYAGYFFNDSDVYKVMEGAAYALHHDPDARCGDKPLDLYLDELISKIAAMQWEDGYVNSYFTLRKNEPRWTDIEHKHELYCAGHLIEAAVAHHAVTGKRNFLNVAIRLADHIGESFGPGRNMNPCGHPEVEIALLRLSEVFAPPAQRIGIALDVGASAVTPDPGRADRYRALAAFFVNQHGRKEGRERLWGAYAQDDKPLVEQTEIAGHAVRAMYLYSAATDLARRGEGADLAPTLERLWTDLTTRKMYVTGGIGSSAHNEGFTAPYDLPNDTAYAESCAAIGMVFWNHRLNLLHGDAKYFDVLERALYNGVLSGISLDGEKFFYTNPLASRGQHQRVPWYPCACCPPNFCRLLTSVGNYVYAVGIEDDGAPAVYLNMYAATTARLELPGGQAVTIRQTGRGPWSYDVKIAVEVEKPVTFALKLREPGWSAGFEFENPAEYRAVKHGGYRVVRREWRGRTEFGLRIENPVLRLTADGRVRANVGRAAMQRGPIVYCVEEADNPAARGLILEDARRMAVTPMKSELGEVIGLTGEAKRVVGDERGARGLYRASSTEERCAITAIPFHMWANRGAGAMMVWLPIAAEFCDPRPEAGIRPSASHCYERDTTAALHDRVEATSSNDHSIPRFTWWPRKGGGEKSDGAVEWVQYEFEQAREVSEVEVYWFDDGPHGGCRVPASWKLMYRSGVEEEAWREVRARGAYGVELNVFNRVEFEVVRATALRIEAQLQEGMSGGILEWRVE